MITVTDLRVDYDDVCAVRDVSFSVAPGQVCGLIGPNGAGKTSTLRALLGLVEPTYGEIHLAGVDVRERPRDAWKHVGFMPDFPPAYDDLNCWEFLDLFAASYFVPRANRRELVNQHLELVGLTEKRGVLVGTLSRGMRQRLMLAKTLMPNPSVIVFDEPASGMDPQGRIGLKNILKQLGDQGKAVIISSHILAEMGEFCNSVVIMERGRVVAHGTIDEVRAMVQGASTIEIETLADQNRVVELLRNDPLASAIEPSGQSIRVVYSGDPAETSQLLAKLVSIGVPIVGFQRRKAGLEEIFLKIGARELA